MSKVIGFYSHNDEELGYMSNWYPSEFRYAGVTYCSGEQYVMAQKARIFGDEESFRRIMEVRSQSRIKALGKLVKNYDDQVWDRLRGPIMRCGLRAKFQQNPALLEKLLKTGNAVLAECAPRDRIWGIGLAGDDERVQQPDQWRGRNLLGTALMEVRADLRRWLAAGDITYMDAQAGETNEIWTMPASLAAKLPGVKEAMALCSEAAACNGGIRWEDSGGSLLDMEHAVTHGLRPAGRFFEMKQDIFDLIRFGG